MKKRPYTYVNYFAFEQSAIVDDKIVIVQLPDQPQESQKVHILNSNLQSIFEAKTEILIKHLHTSYDGLLGKHQDDKLKYFKIEQQLVYQRQIQNIPPKRLWQKKISSIANNLTVLYSPHNQQYQIINNSGQCFKHKQRKKYVDFQTIKNANTFLGISDQNCTLFDLQTLLPLLIIEGYQGKYLSQNIITTIDIEQQLGLFIHDLRINKIVCNIETSHDLITYVSNFSNLIAFSYPYQTSIIDIRKLLKQPQYIGSQSIQMQAQRLQFMTDNQVIAITEDSLFSFDCNAILNKDKIRYGM